MVAAAGGSTLTLHSLRTRALGVTPLRICLGFALLGLARSVGAARGPAYLAFALGVAGIVFVIFNDPRARFLRREVEPLPFPSGAEVAPPWRQTLAASLPSTVGVTALALVALAFRPALAALLAGVCAGLGVASLLSLGRIDPALHVDPKTNLIYRR